MTDALPDPQATPVGDPLADRYGRRTGRRRFPLWIAAALVAGVPFLAWLFWVIAIQVDPAVQSSDRNFTIVDEHLVVAQIVVTLADDAVDPTCRVTAIARDKQPVGDKQFTPVEGRNDVEIETERRATAIELIGCTAKGQNHPR